jgi:hypothetical protein
MIQVKALEQNNSRVSEVRSENEQLKKELNLAKTELRKMKVHNIVADTKIM